MTHISAIAEDPRPIGSAQHDEARAYLLDELGSLGWRTEVQESIGMFDFGLDGTQPIAAVANVIATRPGTASTRDRPLDRPLRHGCRVTGRR